MNRVTHITKNDTLVVYVQGWLGSTQTPLSQGILNSLEQNHIDYWAFDFKGHSSTDPHLSTLTEMVDTIESEIALIKKLYPKKSIILIGHSQGCVVLYRYLVSRVKTPFPTLFITPAFDIYEIIINKRLTEEERTILTTKSITKEFRPNLFKTITPEWMQDYKTQEYSQVLPKGTYLAIFGKQDPVIDYQINNDIFQKISRNSHSRIIEGDHVFSKTEQILLDHIQKFLAKVAEIK